MTGEHTLPDLRPKESYDAFRAAFEWDLPEQYNIARECLWDDGSTTPGIALYHVNQDGGHHTFSFDALDQASASLAAAMRDWGVTGGSHIAVCFPQSPELLISHLATYRLGAVTVPVSVLLGRESLEYTLSHSDTDVMLIDADVYERFRENVFDTVERVVPVSLAPSRYAEAAGYLGGLTEVVDPVGSAEFVDTAPDTPATILYTSGTSGRPKGVLHGHRYLAGSLPGYQLWFHLQDPDTFAAQRVWTPSEWAWAGALFSLVFPTLAMGGTVVSNIRRSGFDPDSALSLINDVGATRAVLPPTALSRIRQAIPQPDTTLPSLEVVQSGGEPLSPNLQEWAEMTFDIVVNEAYGQTEANALVGNCRLLLEHRAGSVGKPYPGHKIRFIDENEEPVETGELGELAVETPDPVVFLEYWNEPEATAAKFTDDGLLKTGDVGFVDDEGYVWIHGRKDDLIISSGYRVSPVEIEKTLEDHTLVNEAVVGGVPGPNETTRIKAYILLKSDADEMSESVVDEFRDYIRTELAAYKIPDDFEVINELPQTRSGKVDRSVLFEADGS